MLYLLDLNKFSCHYKYCIDKFIYNNDIINDLLGIISLQIRLDQIVLDILVTYSFCIQFINSD